MQLGRDDFATYLISILDAHGVLRDRAVLAEAIQWWRDTPGLFIADGNLAALAMRDDAPHVTKNECDVRG